MTNRPQNVRIDVWRWVLDRPQAQIEALRPYLSREEAERAARFVRPIHGSRYTAGRGRLREILASYLGCAPAAVEIHTDAFGKPYVTPDVVGSLHFNLSHSRDQALLAVSREFALGVDIEMIRPIGERMERIFSQAEQQALARLSGAAWTLGFYNCWTRKEAFVKAVGRGLFLPLEEFDVTLAPGEPALLLRHEGHPEAARRWRLISLQVQSGFAGALATPAWDAEIELIDRTEG